MRIENISEECTCGLIFKFDGKKFKKTNRILNYRKKTKLKFGYIPCMIHDNQFYTWKLNGGKK